MLDINIIKKRTIKYLLLTIFVLIFSLIYEHFSFGVISNYMVFAFIFPLCGLVINFIMLVIKSKRVGEFQASLFDMSMLTFTLGCIIQGIIEIYGTTNSLIINFKYAGITLLILCLATTLINMVKKIKRND